MTTDAEPRGWHRSRLVWGAGIVALLVGLYALLGFKVAPGIVRAQAIDYVRETYGRELQIGEVRVHPFLLQFDVRDVAFPDADGTTMLGLRRLFVDFELSSLWNRAFTFSEVAVEAPAIRAVVRPDGAMNLADLAPPEPPGAPPPAEDEGIPSVWIQRLDVTDGALDFVDRARRTPFERRFAPVAFSLQDFRTTPEGGDFRLSARSQSDEQFDWKGRFALAPQVSSEGEITIAALNAPGVAEFLGDALPFWLTSGRIDLAGTYRVTLADTTDLKLQLPSVKLAGLALRARGAEADWVRIPTLQLSDIAVALPEQTVKLARVGVTGLEADAWLAADGTVNVQQLFAPVAASGAAPAGAAIASADASGTARAAAPPPAAAPSATAPAATAPGSSPTAPTERPWQVQVASIEVDDAKLHVEDRMQAPVKKFEVAPVRLRVRDASLDLSKPLPVELTARINDHADFTATGTLTPEPLAMEFDVALDRARMSIVQPYVLPLADLTIRGGLAAVKGRFEMRPPGTPPSEMSFAGDIVLTDFKSTDNALDEDFVNFGRVQVEKLRYDAAPDSVRIDRILIREPYSRVIISRERMLNVSAVLDPAGAQAALQARRDQEAARARETPAERREREKREKAAAAAVEKQRKAEARRGGAKPAAATPAAVAPETLPIRIREVKIERGLLNFSDFNVQPNFSAEIRQLSGTVTGLSTSPTSRAKLALTGNVGEFSPVKIDGELQPFMFDRYTNVQLSFANISLPVFNPYSGEFAGYSIAKGKLDTELSYLIEDRKLDAKHHIRIDQLEWGEATAERGEATLPVKFATVLLRDKDGVIDLNLPVTGTLDDPKFRIGPIVWQVIKNLIVKAVTAPFALLGSLFSGSEEAQFVDFAPGGSELQPAQAERLATLSKALVEKPGLQLEIPLGAKPELDGPALRDSRFTAARASAMRAKLKKPADDDTPLPDFDTLESKQRIEVLSALIQKQTGAAPTIPEPPPPPEGTSRADARAMRDAAALEYLEKTARESVSIGDADFEALGQQRAESVQRALLANAGLEPSRVFLVKNGKLAAQDGKVRLELGLK
jgi:uncharacterized protein involved in outer membrane biogenesis